MADTCSNRPSSYFTISIRCGDGPHLPAGWVAVATYRFSIKNSTEVSRGRHILRDGRWSVVGV